MARFGLFCLLFLIASCGNNKASAPKEETEAENHGQFDRLFSEKNAPYQLSDTALLNNKDTAQIHLQTFFDFLPDSLKTALFGTKGKVRYTPLARFAQKKNSFYLVKGSSGEKRVAILVVAEGPEFKAVLPFLVPDNNPETKQHTVLEKNFSVARNITQRREGDVNDEGKDVFAYSEANSSFDLVMTDPLNDQDIELINPIDTLPRTHKLAGDYRQSKKNLVSVRDGRKPGLLTIFIHIEKNDGTCTGEIKGDAEITSPTTAVYRQAGDPCILTLSFSKNSVTLQEQEGCGSKRGIECSFDGSFSRKKEQKIKNAVQKRDPAR